MMPSSLNQIITQIVYILPALLVSVTFHELAHGYVAYKLGDPTAKKMGRLTLNPIKHLDPMGTAMLIFFRFGWAKPVPYNPNYFKNRKQGTFLVAVAGPLTNIVLAFIAVVSIGLFTPEGVILIFLSLLFQFNIIFAVFNLLPVPPLDGSKIVASVLPDSVEATFWQWERYGYIALIILAVTGMITRIINPVYQWISQSFIYIANILVGG